MKQGKSQNAKAPRPVMKQTEAPSKDEKLIVRLVLGLILATAAIIYWKTLNYGILLYDDGSYMMNEYMKELSWKNISAIFSSFYLGNYHPLTTMVWALLYKVSGTNYGSYHLISMIFHLCNIALVYVFFKRISGKVFTGLFIAAIFAVHPINVESVAWIAELKNVMYSFFFLISLIFYWSYLKKDFKLKYLLLSALFFLLSLLSKSAAVVLPLIFMALDYYSGRKFSLRSLGEKIPFFLLSLLFGLLAIFSQDSAMMGAEFFGIWPRILCSFYGLWFYFYSFFIPVNQSVMHIFPLYGNFPLIYYISIPAVIIGVGLLLLLFRKRRKEVVFGMLFYFINLLLVLQIISFGSTVVAERYSYLPMLGILFILATFIEPYFHKKSALLKGASSALVLIFILLSYLSFERTKAWKDTATLFTDAVKANSNNFIAQMNLGDAYYAMRDTKKAYENYTRSIKIVPTAGAYFARGKLLQKTSDLDGAIRDYDSAVYYSPFSPAYLYPLGIAQVEKKQYYKAMRSFERALESISGDTESRLGYAYCLLMTGQYTSALSNYFVAYNSSPNDPFIPYNIGIVYQKLGLKDTACSYLKIAYDQGFPQAMEEYPTYCGQ